MHGIRLWPRCGGFQCGLGENQFKPANTNQDHQHALLTVVQKRPYKHKQVGRIIVQGLLPASYHFSLIDVIQVFITHMMRPDMLDI